MNKKNELGGSFYKLLNKDIKELNGIIVSLFSVLFLVGVGFISYTLTNNSYALFGDSLIGSKTIEVEAVVIKNGADTIIAKVGTGGLEEIIHEADSTLQIGTTADITEYRYRGANPNNYVSFNNETWRIIGVFPTDDGTGNIENRIKIIRNDSIGTYAWNSNSGTTYNNWAEATLNTYLNNDYYNSLNSTSKSMIENAKYYLGGFQTLSAAVTKEEIYSNERKVANNDNCTCPGAICQNCYFYSDNPINHTNKIAIMYASDFGYAAGGNCSQTLDNYDDSTCANNNWLAQNEAFWILTPNAFGRVMGAFGESNFIGLGIQPPSQLVKLYQILPVLYLSSDVMITGGAGTSSDPYILSK